MAIEQKQFRVHQVKHTQLDLLLCQNSKRNIWLS